ncbi:MAG: multiheme c-type cytochrome [Acidobacteriota bacterium]
MLRHVPSLLALALFSCCPSVPPPRGSATDSTEGHARVVSAKEAERQARVARLTTPEASPLADAEHVGSERCAPCHPNHSTTWSESSHATTVRNADIDDEELVDSFIECSGGTFTHVLGDRHHQRFLWERDEVPFGEGRWLALPCGYDLHEDEITSHHEGDWRKLPWESHCAACHVTGFRDDDHGFLELGIGCEECHGPAGDHVTTGDRDAIFRPGTDPVAELTVCASCHLQGGQSRHTGRKFPHGFVPGGSLFDDWEFDWSTLFEDEKKVLDIHQKLLIKQVLFEGQRELACSSCHDIHSLSHEKHQTLPRSEFCSLCHQPDMKLKEYSTSCNVCEF